MRHFILTEQQAGKLPRWALLLLCALYVFPGLIGREPWRTGDAPGFATTLTMIRGHWQDWLIPNIAGEIARDEGPFAYALLAAINKALAFVLGPVTLAAPWPHWIGMLGAAIGLITMLAAFWYAAHALARRPGLQPLDPFGAAASRTDFGRAIADTALLVLIATLGLLIKMHEISSTAAQVTWVAIYLWGLALALENPRIGAFMAAMACGAIFMTRSPPLALMLTLAGLALCLWAPAYKLVRRKFLSLFLPASVIASSIWPLLVLFTLDASTASLQGGSTQSDYRATVLTTSGDFLSHWLSVQIASLEGPSLTGLAYLLRTIPWYFWPAWPLAAYSVWRWREKLGEPALAMPLTVLIAMALLWLLHPHPGETQLAAAAPVVALLAAPSLTTLRRSLVNMIDWFAVMCFSFLGLALWTYWFALLTGQPEKIAFRAGQFAPNFSLGPIWLEIFLGGMASASWILLVTWRISRQPPMIWRAVVLSASGLSLVWLLMMTLWLPVLNERLGFRQPGEDLKRAIAETTTDPAACVHIGHLDLAPKAIFFYFAELNIAPATSNCPFLLEQTKYGASLKPEFGTLIWHGVVPAYRDDEYRLYLRKPLAPIRP